MHVSVTGRPGSPAALAVAVLRCGLFLLSLLLLCPGARSQALTLTLRGVPFEEALRLMEVQSPLRFVYTRQDLAATRPLTFAVASASPDSVLTLLFCDQPLCYHRLGNLVVIRRKSVSKDRESPPVFRGRVLDEEGQAVARASVRIKGTSLGTVADRSGTFLLQEVHPNDTLLVSAVGYEPAAAAFAQGKSIILRRLTPMLDETVVIGYGQTTRRKLTGSVSRITGSVLQHSSALLSPVASLQGRAGGVLITRQSGLPDAPFLIRIRGRNGLQSGSEPLYVVDGVPSLAEGLPLSQRSGLQTLAPFDAVVAEDLESIEILKDADATAIYGSRGAGGVVLITTRKPVEGKPSGVLQLVQGWGRTGRTPEYLPTADYLTLRREAFFNDGVQPTAATAPDLTAWDTTADRKWKRLLLGETARFYKVYTRVSGGSRGWSYMLSGTASHQTTVFPAAFPSSRALLSGSGSRGSRNGKFTAMARISAGGTRYRLPARDLTAYLSLPPDMYAPYDAAGKLRWAEGGQGAGNPLAAVHQPFTASLHQLSYSTTLSCKVLPRLEARSLWGGHLLRLTEELQVPIASQDPAVAPAGSLSRGSKSGVLWIWEPSMVYSFPEVHHTRATLLAGATLQQTHWNSALLTAQGFRDDALLGSLEQASSLSASSSATRYRYSGLYGRFTAEHRERYLLQLTARRDGSSRFGPGRQFGNFMALGGGWLFYREKGIKRRLPWLRYGKLRLTWGTTGNDRIGDYGYQALWRPSPLPYSGGTAWTALRLYNPEFGWEVTNKKEAALEWGLLNDRLWLSTAIYCHRSGNQIIRYPLPAQTGFTWFYGNIPALVENRGLELDVSFSSRPQSLLHWKGSLQLSFPQGRLLAFPELQESVYAALYTIGKPLNSLRGYGFQGVDPASGLYCFADQNNDGHINRQDEQYIGSTDPAYFGGLEQELRWKGWTLELQLYFLRGLAPDPVYSSGSPPGDFINLPRQVTDRWHGPGEAPRYQRATQDVTGEAYYPSAVLATRSSALLTDGSFVRLNQVALSYHRKRNKPVAAEWRWFLQGQNLLTLTRYPGDPETHSLSVLPPLRTLETGLILHF